MSNVKQRQNFILLLRGINVGGPTRSLPMKELVAMLESLNCKSIQTYIQSGNIVLNLPEAEQATLPGKLASAILKAKGFEPTILLLSAEAFQKAIEDNPFPEAIENPKLLHVGFLAKAPPSPDLKTLQSLLIEEEKIKLVGSCFYHFAANGYGRSKIALKAEKLLGVAMTDRNWNTVLKLQSMLKA